MPYNSIIILGPTASGKTKLAAHIAYALQGQIISVDSRQVYRQMNIGTGKDYSEYTIHEKNIPFHLIDTMNAGEQYNVHQFKTDATWAIKTILEQQQLPILCGGTGLYMDALLQPMQYTSVPRNDMLRAQLQSSTSAQLLDMFQQLPTCSYTHLADTSTDKRLVRAIEIIQYIHQHGEPVPAHTLLQPLIIGLHLPLQQRRARIANRLLTRLENGLIDEVEQLLKTLKPERLIYYGLEYKYVTLYLQGILSLDALKEQLTIAIQQYAKRQMTYFRKMEKDGKKIEWIDATLPIDELVKQVINLFNN
jgi:tRNA dimethylallyltransferase